MRADYVIKEIPDFIQRHSHFNTLEVLQQVYSAADASPHLIHAPEGPKLTQDGTYRVKLRPLGTSCPVSAPVEDEDELKLAIRDTLRGLETLHDSGETCAAVWFSVCCVCAC